MKPIHTLVGWAAKGPEGLTYPWGNEFDEDKMNADDKIDVVAVGCFPRGASLRDSVEDLMGWSQWTRSGYRGFNDMYDPYDGRELPGFDDDYVLRGYGNGKTASIDLATTYRRPSDRLRRHGFRVSIGRPVPRSSLAFSLRQPHLPTKTEVE